MDEEQVDGFFNDVCRLFSRKSWAEKMGLAKE